MKGHFSQYLRHFENKSKLSEEIITLFTGQMDTASTRMSFLLNPSLKQQLEYLKVQVKFEHMQKLYVKFDGMKDELIEDLQERVEVFGSVYQLRDPDCDSDISQKILIQEKVLLICSS